MGGPEEITRRPSSAVDGALLTLGVGAEAEPHLPGPRLGLSYPKGHECDPRK